ncbi:hypothetical protein [Roseimaritima ulvae]|uniref:Uncharacterized protein n=1 Tax=Roseimaritima ulvae TaxID=980254 RepID=A0A5B9R536_9BACT|nr:hypothetical protein [Roseimaritima ulvae]QEG41333.1 hypothetical protein UC8_33520 [Roseimaritima ulvae]
MKKISKFVYTPLASTLVLITYAGCDDKQPPLTSSQVDEFIAMPADATAASRELVEQDAKARQEWLSMQSEMQAEVIEIGRQRDALESDRRAIATQRHVEPILATALQQTGLLAACLLPVLMLTFLVWPRKPAPDTETVCDLLITEVTRQAELPKLGARPIPPSRLDAHIE